MKMSLDIENKNVVIREYIHYCCICVCYLYVCICFITYLIFDPECHRSQCVCVAICLRPKLIHHSCRTSRCHHPCMWLGSMRVQCVVNATTLATGEVQCGDTLHGNFGGLPGTSCSVARTELRWGTPGDLISLAR